MKFFSTLRSCYCGSTISPAPETAPPLPEKLAGDSHAPLTKFHSAPHWKPALPVISEDSFASEIHKNRSIERTATSKKKLCAKTRSTAKDRYLSNSDEHRKICNTMALPTFSPTPFVF